MIEIKAQKKPRLFDVERNLPIKITENGGNLFRKALVLKILFNMVKVVHGSTKLFMVDLLLNGLLERVMICYLK